MPLLCGWKSLCDCIRKSATGKMCNGGVITCLIEYASDIKSDKLITSFSSTFRRKYLVNENMSFLKS